MEDKPPPLLVKNFFVRRFTQIAYYDIAIFVFLCMDNIVNPIDMGHDDFDCKAGKDGRSRTWMILLYEDDLSHFAVLNGRLSELDWNFAGRIHDQEEGIKSHHHVVVLFKDGRKAADVASDLGIDVRWLRPWDRYKKALRYLCHRDNPDKFQYDTDGIYGTIAEKAVALCSKADSMSESQGVSEIVGLLDEIDGFVSYKFFLCLVSSKGLYPVFRRMGIIATRLLDEHNNSIQTKLNREIQNATDQDDFRRFIKNLHDLPFDEYCEIMERKFGSQIKPL